MRPTTNAHAARLREKANDCEFEANCDERILETSSKQHRIDCLSKKPSTRNGIWQFLPEAAQIEDTSLQISDMKIPQDVKKLGRQFEKRRPPKNMQSGRILRTNRHTRGRQELSSVWEKMYEMSKVQSLQFCVQVQGSIQQQEMARAKTQPQASRKSRTQAPHQENYWSIRRCWQLNKFEWWVLLPSRKAPEVSEENQSRWWRQNRVSEDSRCWCKSWARQWSRSKCLRWTPI